MLSAVRILKLIVLAGTIVLGLLCYALSDRMPATAHATIAGPPTGRTGAPGESTCTTCHFDNPGNGHLTITAPANYVPGQTYQIQVVHTATDTTRKAWGFELTSLAGNVSAGTLVVTSSTTRLRTGSGRNYLEHGSTGTFANQTGGASWSMNWTAPATDVGPVTFYAAGIQGDNDGSEDGDQTYLATAQALPQAAVVIHHGFADFDGDGRADASVFRPASGTWYLNRSTQGQFAAQFGLATDKPVAADFDGDDKADIAVWREAPAEEAAFYILQSSTGTVRIEKFGQTGDLPLTVGDWDGDGKADPSVYRDSAIGSQSYFFYRGSLNNPTGTITYVPWGAPGDRPLHGDFDGDGKVDAAVFRPATQTWYIRQSATNTVRAATWGLATDKFVPADYDGDGKTDLAVFRGGAWYVWQSSNGVTVAFSWGLASDVPVPADYDGDAKTDLAVYRGGVWYVRLSSTGNASVVNFGGTADLPLPSTAAP